MGIRFQRMALVGLLTVLFSGFPLLRAAMASTTTDTSRHRSTIEARLSLEANALVRSAHRTMGTGVSVPMVRLEAVAERDVTADIQKVGGRIRANIHGRIVAASVPVDRVYRMASIPGIQGLYAIDRLYPDASRNVSDIGANSVWSADDRAHINIQGHGVLIGFVDSGIDYRNLDFTGPNGETRIKAIWDQTVSGRSPEGFTFGYECGVASITSRSCPERDTEGHGTHVAGIAAGSGRSNPGAPLQGVAPSADLAVVKTDGQSDNVIAAWQYLVKVAQRLHEPLVVNTSMGSVMTPHDGSSPLGLAIDQLAGPGRIFVGAAGNEGNQATHTRALLRNGVTTSLSFVPKRQTSTVRVGVFFREGYNTEVTLTNTDTGEIFDSNDSRISHAGVRVTIGLGAFNSSYWEVFLELTSATAISGHFRLDLTPAHVAANPRVDAWTQQTMARFFHPDESNTVESPASAHSAIAVGDYATQTQWTGLDRRSHSFCLQYTCRGGVQHIGDIAYTSSMGPTTDGREKPDISAPGTIIQSSLSEDASLCTGRVGTGCISPAFVSRNGHHLLAAGTSMSAPHVSGTVALMLQIDPSLNQARATSILRSSARHDAFTGQTGWTATFGAGKLNALGAVAAVPGAPTLRVKNSSTGSTPPAMTASTVPGITIDRMEILQFHGGTVRPTTTVTVSRQAVFLLLYHTVGSLPPPQIGFVIFRGGFVVRPASVQIVRVHGVPGVLCRVTFQRTQPLGRLSAQFTLRSGHATAARSRSFNVAA